MDAIQQFGHLGTVPRINLNRVPHSFWSSQAWHGALMSYRRCWHVASTHGEGSGVAAGSAATIFGKARAEKGRRRSRERLFIKTSLAVSYDTIVNHVVIFHFDTRLPQLLDPLDLLKLRVGLTE